MFLFRSKENAQRKYIDLIKDAAAKWPNWDPPRNIRVSTVSRHLLVAFTTTKRVLLNNNNKNSPAISVPSVKRRES